MRRQAGARNADEHFPALNLVARVSLVQQRAKTRSPDKCRSECASRPATWRRRGTESAVFTMPCGAARDGVNKEMDGGK